jgi:hypothetical protein
MSHTNDASDLSRRATPTVPEGDSLLVEDYASVFERFRALGIENVPAAAVLPRNFDTAKTAQDLVSERTAPDIKIVGRRAGVDVTTFEGVGAREIHENDALTIGAVIWLSVETFNNVGTIVAFMKEIAKFAKARSRSKPEAELEITQEFIVGDEYRSTRFVYRGPASTLESIVPTMKSAIGPRPEETQCASAPPEQQSQLPSGDDGPQS